MRLLQRKKEDFRLQQWSLPLEVSQGCCLLPGLPHRDHLYLLRWMPFFREFDQMSVSSHHAEYFWIFDDVKVEFHGFRVPQGGVRFLEALWKKYGSCSAYLKLGVYIKGFMLTLICCMLGTCGKL
jgi:hypothetical protein